MLYCYRKLFRDSFYTDFDVSIRVMISGDDIVIECGSGIVSVSVRGDRFSRGASPISSRFVFALKGLSWYNRGVKELSTFNRTGVEVIHKLSTSYQHFGYKKNYQ